MYAEMLKDHTHAGNETRTDTIADDLASLIAGLPDIDVSRVAVDRGGPLTSESIIV